MAAIFRVNVFIVRATFQIKLLAKSTGRLVKMTEKNACQRHSSLIETVKLGQFFMSILSEPSGQLTGFSKQKKDFLTTILFFFR